MDKAFYELSGDVKQSVDVSAQLSGRNRVD